MQPRWQGSSLRSQYQMACTCRCAELRAIISRRWSTALRSAQPAAMESSSERMEMTSTPHAQLVTQSCARRLQGL